MRKLLLLVGLTMISLFSFSQTLVHDNYMQLVAVSKIHNSAIKCELAEQVRWCDMCEWNGFTHWHYYSQNYYVTYDFRPYVAPRPKVYHHYVEPSHPQHHVYHHPVHKPVSRPDGVYHHPKPQPSHQQTISKPRTTPSTRSATPSKSSGVSSSGNTGRGQSTRLTVNTR